MKNHLKKTLFISCLWTVTAIIAFVLNSIFNSTNVINLTNLPQSFIEDYLKSYAKMASSDNKENILIVTSMHPLNDTYGASSIVEAPNHQYFLQYDSEPERKLAFAYFSNDKTLKVSENHTYELLENEYFGFGYDDPEDPSKTYNSWGIEAMGLDHASEIIEKTDTNPVTVAVIDTGLDVNLFNKYYSNKLAGTYNIQNPGIEITDEYGHGTHVAGTIAEGTPSNVKILVIKLGYSNQMTSTDIITAINYASYDHKADVINMSFGGYDSEEAIHTAIEAAYQNNIIPVASAGNDNTSQISYPAGYENTLSIASVDSYFSKSSFSNYGPTIDFTAPGTAIKSIMDKDAEIAKERLDDHDDDHEVIDGTSMAAPHFTSAVAILKSLNKNLSLEDVKEALKGHAIDLGEKNKDDYYGYGFVDYKNTEICSPESTDCDTLGLLEIIKPGAIEISDTTLTPYNYGSQTNILATKLSITTTNGKTIEKALGEFNYGEIEIEGYDPYSQLEQSVTVRYNDLETSFSIQNPDNYPLGWEYIETNNGTKLQLTEYKNHNLNIKTLYFPSEIDNKPVTEIGGDCIFGTPPGLCRSFIDSNNYTTVILPETIKEIKDSYTFKLINGENFINLEHFISQAEELTIPSNAFSNQKRLQTVEANILFTQNSFGAFLNDTALQSVTLSNNNTIIPEEAFKNSAIKELSIPASVAIIDPSAFFGTNNLIILEVDPNNTIYDSRNNSNAIIKTDEDKLIVGISTTVIPDSVKTIASYAFFNLDNLTEITIPEGVTTIESNAIFQCYSLWKVVLPTSLNSLNLDSIDNFHSNIISAYSKNEYVRTTWVHRNSYAHEFAQDHNLIYAIIGESDPDPITLLISKPPEEKLYAFNTINPNDVDIMVIHINLATKEQRVEHAIPTIIEYQNGLDSLRATSGNSTFEVTYHYNTDANIYNLTILDDIQVKKAIPTYEAPTGLTADPGQTLSEIPLPERFSWVDENEVIGGAGDMVYNARFTPEDTDNYEIIEVPITIYVTTDKEIIIPEFSIEPIYHNEAIPLNPDIITIANMDKGSYEITNITFKGYLNVADVTFSLRMSDELFESYYFEGGLQEKEFTVSTEIIPGLINTIVKYDGEYHTLSSTSDFSQCVAKYSTDGESYTLDTIPSYKELGNYTIYYDITCEKHHIIGHGVLSIYIIIGDTSGDGIIDETDLELIRQHLLGNQILEGSNFFAGDITKDEKIDSADLLRIKQHLLGINPINN